MIDPNPSRNLAVRRRADCVFGVFLLPVLIAGLGLIPAGGVRAQTFTTLHSFTATSDTFPPTNSDGVLPYTVLVLSGNNLYGTTHVGGSGGGGTVFRVNTNGTGFTTVYSFTPLVSFQNDDGANPSGVLILSSNTLYGTTYTGGGFGQWRDLRREYRRHGFYDGV